MKIEFDVEITDENIDDIMSCAFEGGINYWCGKVEVLGDYLGAYASDQISRGGKLVIYDIEEPDCWVLNKEKMLKGIEKFIKFELERGQKVLTFDDGKCVLADYMMDAIWGDLCVQFALFGEIVFG